MKIIIFILIVLSDNLSYAQIPAVKLLYKYS